MMKTTARRPEPEFTFGALLRAGLAGAGMAIVRNPVAVGGTTAFLVSFAFVSANALWYQPHFHSGALISTRTPVFVEREPEVPVPTPAAVRRTPDPVQRALKPSDDTTGAIPSDRPDVVEGGDPTVRQVQKVLGDLGLYQGVIDGLQGPQTRKAIGNYRRIVGLDTSETVDGALLRQLGLADPAPATQETAETVMPVAAVVPLPSPRPALARQTVEAEVATQAPAAAAPANLAVETASLASEADPTIMRIQAGLKAFGNDGIKVDGVLGRDTQVAIREFQSLFGLPVTGQPDEPFLAKMREVGLTN
ncbi:peptidoglycan-binding protein [Nitratireductor sp. ZSWI3]|uniref:peptidoglycan-binding domain-containing protein n=1 Tax=Nitratireductor sp. ZSWI3 TaxID=2966359 RepID=UPI00214FE7D8|nr:peptidoglycan-binding protein [Nitratireductor sp. ZSWI3]MCR4265334.1 peptidoglycan-binding protein [Nitratireductor sp. ZSWI3]